MGSRPEFLSRLRSGPVDLRVDCGQRLVRFVGFRSYRHAQATGVFVPLIIIENEADEPREVVPSHSGASDYHDASQFPRLPAIVERVLRERREGGRQDAGWLELEHAAEYLRDNQKQLTLGRLTASIVHQINNPLESLINLLYLMEVEQHWRGSSPQ